MFFKNCVCEQQRHLVERAFTTAIKDKILRSSNEQLYNFQLFNVSPQTNSRFVTSPHKHQQIVQLADKLEQLILSPYDEVHRYIYL